MNELTANELTAEDASRMLNLKTKAESNVSHLPAKSRDQREIENLKCRIEVMLAALDDIQNVPAYNYEQCAFISQMALASVEVIKRDIR